ncbi:STAS domain-containing protein [bacterium]|nr:STAS domain-containing protein [bacterium]
MKCEQKDVGDVTIISLSGKITIGEGDEALRNIITEVLDRGKRKLLLNLENVKYMDSAGIGELIRCYTTVTNKGGKLKLLKLTKKIKDLLTITKLISIFEDFAQEEEALKSFS